MVGFLWGVLIKVESW